MKSTLSLFLNRLRPAEELVIKFFFISVILGVVIIFSAEIAKISPHLVWLSLWLSVFSGFAGLVYYIYSYSSYLNIYTKWMIFLLFYFFVIGILSGDFNFPFSGGVIVQQDLRYIMYFTIGSILANRRYMPYFHKMMKFLGYTSIVAAIFGLLFFNFSIQQITERSTTWSFSYYCWWIVAACFMYWGYYTIITKKEKLIGYGVLLSYFILGILFLKRSVFINVVVLLLLANILSTRSFFKSTSRIILLVFFIGLLVFLLNSLFKLEAVDNIFNLMSARFQSTENIEDIDRVKEWQAYYESSNFRQLLFGNGIGNYPALQISEIFSLDRVNALHIGFYNIIFKGGLIYALFYILLYLKVFGKLFRLNTLGKYELVCLGVALSAFISLFYEGSWTYALEPFCISAPIFYTALSKK